mgnify:CR=1 FL=1
MFYPTETLCDKCEKGNQFIDDKLDMYEIVIDTIASGSVISEIVDDEKTYFIHPISGEIINVKIKSFNQNIFLKTF